MLRITDVRETMPDGKAVWTLRLDGAIQGQWVKELGHAWRAVKLAAAGVSIRVKLGDVQIVDAAGRALLSDMHRDGVEIIASDDFTASLREAIFDRRDADDRDGLSAPQIRTQQAQENVMDMKLEIVVIPVSNVDRAKEFYARLGWRLDADFASDDGWRVIQFTPPGSGCSVIFGDNVTAAAPGSAQGLYLVVSDIQAARDEMLRRGVEMSEVFHGAGDVHTGGDEPYLSGRARVSGPDPERRSYGSYASFRDPDGNGWFFQEITTRLPGRIDPATTTFASPNDLAGALRRAARAHGEHEARTGQKDANWPDWYATYVTAEQSGAKLPS